MISGHSANPIFFDKILKIGCPEHLLPHHPLRSITSHFYLNPVPKWKSYVYHPLTSPSPPCGFLKNVSSIEMVEPWFFVTFNIILKHIFSQNFIEFPLVVQRI